MKCKPTSAWTRPTTREHICNVNTSKTRQLKQTCNTVSEATLSSFLHDWREQRGFMGFMGKHPFHTNKNENWCFYFTRESETWCFITVILINHASESVVISSCVVLMLGSLPDISMNRLLMFFRWSEQRTRGEMKAGFRKETMEICWADVPSAHVETGGNLSSVSV